MEYIGNIGPGGMQSMYYAIYVTEGEGAEGTEVCK